MDKNKAMRKKIAGVYKITNTVNRKFYIGSSNNISSRWTYHRWECNKNISGSTLLQRAWNKYGKEKFTFEIIENIPVGNPALLREREQHYLDILKPAYNVCLIVDTLPVMSEERKTALRIRNSLGKGIKRPGISKKMAGVNHPFYGKKRPEHAAKMRGANNAQYKVPHTEAYKLKASLLKIKLTSNQVEEAALLLKDGWTQNKIAEKLNVSRACINRLLSNKLLAYSNSFDTSIDKKKNGALAISGANNWYAKLTEEDILTIRRLRNVDKIPQSEIAKKFNINKSHVSAVGRYQAWKHIPNKDGVEPLNLREKIVLDTGTGVFYNSILEAAAAKGINKITLGAYLTGRGKNKTNLICV